jgi:hypothetical protein
MDRDPIRITPKTSRYYECPTCTEEHDADAVFEHYLGREMGPWSCDGCGDAWYVTAHEDGTMTLRKDERPDRERWERAFVVLEIPPHDKPIRLLLDTHTHVGPGFDDSSRTYFYDEHTCPTNWTRDIAELVIDGDSDPHGFARYVGAYLKGTAGFETLAKVCDAHSSMDHPEDWQKLVEGRTNDPEAT